MAHRIRLFHLCMQLPSSICWIFGFVWKWNKSFICDLWQIDAQIICVAKEKNWTGCMRIRLSILSIQFFIAETRTEQIWSTLKHSRLDMNYYVAIVVNGCVCWLSKIHNHTEYWIKISWKFGERRKFSKKKYICIW